MEIVVKQYKIGTNVSANIIAFFSLEINKLYLQNIAEVVLRYRFVSFFLLYFIYFNSISEHLIRFS
jgi:hypothetical protein